MVNWQTGINLPSLFTGTWKLQPAIAIVNQTSAGPFMIRNQFTNGQFLRQGKRLQFSAGLSPTFFGFFPGIGPIARIRHAISPQISYAYAPGSTVDSAFAYAVDPTRRTFTARSDPQQTISLGLSQNLEAKLKAPPGDTTHAPRKLRILSINTSALSYNFEQAKQPGHTGWQTPSINNSFASELIPGFTLTMTHDLWKGQVGTDSAKFDPFLTNVSAGFAITPATIRGIAALFGLGKRSATSPPAAPPPSGPEGPIGGAVGGVGQTAFAGPGAVPIGGGGRGFNLSITYTQSRTRPQADTALVGGRAGSQQMGLRLSFQPTPHWSATWDSNYNFDTRQFGAHAIHLERDLHRWHASFSFLKAPNGNFAFSFYVAVLDPISVARRLRRRRGVPGQHGAQLCGPARGPGQPQLHIARQCHLPRLGGQCVSQRFDALFRLSRVQRELRPQRRAVRHRLGHGGQHGRAHIPRGPAPEWRAPVLRDVGYQRRRTRERLVAVLAGH